MMRRQIITPDDAHKFFGDCRAVIIASADRERAWLDCAKVTGRKVRAKEIGPAYAADQLREVIREQSLFADDSEDEIQATIAATFERAADEPGLAVNGHGIIAEESPPVTSPGEYGARPTERVEAATPARFRLEMLDEITVADDPVELIQGLLPMGPALGVVFGPPKSLKSFLLKHIALLIAAGRPFCGRAVQGGAVVYVTSEGIRGVRRRLIAARRAMGIEGQSVPFALVSTMPNLGAGETDRGALQKAIFDTLQSIEAPLRMIVIDTLRRAMPGKSENEQKDVSIVVNNCEALARAFGCLVMLVHHSPRSDDQRGSGSNAVDAAADLMWSIIRQDELRPPGGNGMISRIGRSG